MSTYFLCCAPALTLHFPSFCPFHPVRCVWRADGPPAQEWLQAAGQHSDAPVPLHPARSDHRPLALAGQQRGQCAVFEGTLGWPAGQGFPQRHQAAGACMAIFFSVYFLTCACWLRVPFSEPTLCGPFNSLSIPIDLYYLIFVMCAPGGELCAGSVRHDFGCQRLQVASQRLPHYDQGVRVRRQQRPLC